MPERISEMKKLICFLVCFLLATSTAYADEILFRGLKWGINPSEANSTISEMHPIIQNLISDASLRYPSLARESVLDHSKNYLWGNYEYFLQNNAVLRAGAVFDENGAATVGGYKLDTMFLYFSYEIEENKIIYDEQSSHFAVAEYNFNIIDGDTASKDLVDKLTSLYGEGTEYSSEENGSLFYDNKFHPYTKLSRVIIFNGDNGTHAEIIHVKTASTEDPKDVSHALSLYYWNDFYENDIKTADAIIRDEEYRNALEQEQNASKDDMNGL